jgi:hypothetical protein
MARAEFWERPISWFEPDDEFFGEKEEDDEQDTIIQDECEEEYDELSA